ncbi:hypothetical protein Tco_1321508 [Tanacetum coccineum]
MTSGMVLELQVVCCDATTQGILIWIEKVFSASEQQRYEREYGSIYQLDRENSGEYMERFTRLSSFVGATAGDAA